MGRSRVNADLQKRERDLERYRDGLIAAQSVVIDAMEKIAKAEADIARLRGGL